MNFKQILDTYIAYHNLIIKIEQSRILSFENQKTLISFYKNIEKADIIQSSLIYINSETIDFKTQIKFLSTTLKGVATIYDRNKNFFNNLDTKEICKKESERNSFAISQQKKELERLSTEQDEYQDIIRHLDNHNYDENEKKIMFDKYQNKRNEYLKVSSNYASLLSTQNDYYNFVIQHYADNMFEKINILNNLYLKFIYEHLMVNESNIEIYFEKNIIKEIHKITSKEIFNEISFNSFYNNINLIESDENIVVKKGNIFYACYLIKKLYDNNDSENKLNWRKTILMKLGLTDNYEKQANSIEQKKTDGNRAEVFYNNLTAIFNKKISIK